MDLITYLLPPRAVAALLPEEGGGTAAPQKHSSAACWSVGTMAASHCCSSCELSHAADVFHIPCLSFKLLF